MDSPVFHLFTDGACTGNPGPGGWAFILRSVAGAALLVEEAGAESQTTNNRMELLAAIRGLEAVPEPAEVHLFSDSQYLTKGLGEWLDGWKRKGWRTTSGPVRNADLWRELDALRGVHRIRTEWVRGHDGHPENERCDQLAVAAIEAVRGR